MNVRRDIEILTNEFKEMLDININKGSVNNAELLLKLSAIVGKLALNYNERDLFVNMVDYAIRKNNKGR